MDSLKFTFRLRNKFFNNNIHHCTQGESVMQFIIRTPDGESARTVHFGTVFCAPWVRGFYKEEPWFYIFLRALDLTWKQTTFMAKTVTLFAHKGNVPLKRNGKPKYLWSNYVYWNPLRRFMVNSFGLSNPGFHYCAQIWKKFTEPYVISVITLEETRTGRDEEFKLFIQALVDFAKESSVAFAIQYNAGCPNAGAHNNAAHKELIDEIDVRANQLRSVGMPILLNCSPAMPFDILMDTYIKWDGLIVGNTIAFGHPCIPDWTKITFDGISPLMKRGLNVAGGYSGKEATSISVALIKKLRDNGVDVPIIGGNSIQSTADVDAFRKAGANAIMLGSIALNNPLEVSSIIEYANALHWECAAFCEIEKL